MKLSNLERRNPCETFALVLSINGCQVKTIYQGVGMVTMKDHDVNWCSVIGNAYTPFWYVFSIVEGDDSR